MQFVKAHWMSLLSGVVALGAITVAALGLRQDGVVVEMQSRVQQAREISTRRNNPKNQQVIEAEQERGRRFGEQYKKTLDEAARINQRKPLLEGVFPNPPRLDLAYQFQEEYGIKFYELPRNLLAGDVPMLQRSTTNGKSWWNWPGARSCRGRNPLPRAHSRRSLSTCRSRLR